jgi:glucokinase
MSNQSAALTLLADLGGTNVRFGLADPSAPSPLLMDTVRRYRVADFDSLASAAKQYLGETSLEASHAVIAAAGRISDGETVKITNNPWAISAKNLAKDLGLKNVHLVNDFAAQSMAVMLLQPKDLVTVGKPALPELRATGDQTFVIVGPGTGLGVGGLLLREGKYSVLQTEGGHAGFAAHSAEDIEILKRLNERYGRVSNERLICGQGLVNVYNALCDIAGRPNEDLQPEDITRRAEKDNDALCIQAIETFCGIFGSVAGDLVLTLGGWDGVYLTGGMIPVILPWLDRGHFRERFEAKGRFQDTMQQVPTQAIMNPEPGLVGATAIAVTESGRSLLVKD